ncbi:hypothetical protein [Bosea sp. (in: a-proteobacteria)]|uniref:hypothetical protein n=1 Tax=Bosea sp. (in: a-proteobacteria) TaxID=1871050 RepID=UPI002737242C|nr:hypothetical protein [Bosea sp. (in: a-proteobacteria)]MDP3408237.1 hypothetical protein [Bosea sp. (in: a-proteobacteria)]
MSKARPQRETVENLTYFVVQTFAAVKGSRTKISAEPAMEARDHDHAMRLFERYRPIRAGVVAFRRTGDPKTGDWEDGVILARHGLVSAEVDAMAAADDSEADSWDLGAADFKAA